MKIPQILKELAQAHDQFPEKAINAALKNKNKITPHLLDLLTNAVTQYEKVCNDEEVDYLYAVALLAKFREKSAFPLLLKAASLPEEWTDDFFYGETIGLLPRLLISTYDSDLDSLKSLIENNDANIWAREAGMYALIGLVAQDSLSRDEVVSYLKSSLIHPSVMTQCSATFLLMQPLTSIPELMPEITKAYQDDKTMDVLGQDWLQARLEMGKDACIEEYLFSNELLWPVDDVEEVMTSFMGCYSGLDEELDEIIENMKEELFEDTCKLVGATLIKGAEEATTEIAQNLLKEGVAIKTISSATGLSVEEIKLMKIDGITH